MKQCVNTNELTKNDTIFHTDSMYLVQGLSAEEVHKRALAARKLYGKAEKSLTFWIMEMDERKLYNDFGCSNIFQYATRYLSLGEHTIAEILRTGKALAQLPLLSEAFEKGQISSSHIREISRVATKDTEEYWCDTARGKTVREVEKLVAFTPKGGLPGTNNTALKPVSNTAIQPSHSMTPAIPVESAIPSAQTTASEDVLKCTNEGDKLQEPGTDPGMSRQGEQSSAPAMSLQNNQSTTPDIPPQNSVKYHEKLVVDLDAEEMSVLQDAFAKTRKESGLRDRASLLIHIAKAFLEGCPTSGKRRKPRYQIVVHRHLPSDLAWCDTLKGERPVSPEILEKALCDAEIVELDEPENSTWDRTNRPTVSPTGDQSIEKGHNTGITSVAAGSIEADIQNEARDYINEQYMRIKAAKRKGRTQYKSIYNSIRKEGRAIPAPLRKKVLLRDKCTCQAPECGRKLFLTIHHLIAFALCGFHIISGLLVLQMSRSCSRRKAVSGGGGASPTHLAGWEGQDHIAGSTGARLVVNGGRYAPQFSEMLWGPGTFRLALCPACQCCREAGQIRSSCH
ncbi:MAG: HNH endonuclease [Vulcanimicrobiota bacterium]